MIYEKFDIEPLEKAIARLKALQSAQERMEPVDETIKAAGKAMVEALKEKAPELVEAFRAIQVLHTIKEDFIEGKEVHPRVLGPSMTKAQEFIMSDGRELWRQDPPTETYEGR